MAPMLLQFQGEMASVFDWQNQRGKIKKKIKKKNEPGTAAYAVTMEHLGLPCRRWSTVSAVTPRGYARISIEGTRYLLPNSHFPSKINEKFSIYIFIYIFMSVCVCVCLCVCVCASECINMNPIFLETQRFQWRDRSLRTTHQGEEAVFETWSGRIWRGLSNDVTLNEFLKQSEDTTKWKFIKHTHKFYDYIPNGCGDSGTSSFRQESATHPPNSV